MIRIKEKSWIITTVCAGWYFKFNIFMRYVFLLKIHAAEERWIGHNAAFS